MAADSKKKKRERRMRRALNVTVRALDYERMRAAVEGLQGQVKFYAQQNFYATTVLKAVLAQNGDLKVTKGTMQQATEDDQNVFKVDQLDDEQYIVRLVNKLTVTDTTNAETPAQDNTVTVTKIDDETEPVQQSTGAEVV